MQMNRVFLRDGHNTRPSAGTAGIERFTKRHGTLFCKCRINRSQVSCRLPFALRRSRRSFINMNRPECDFNVHLPALF